MFPVVRRVRSVPVRAVRPTLGPGFEVVREQRHRRADAESLRARRAGPTHRIAERVGRDDVVVDLSRSDDGWDGLPVTTVALVEERQGRETRAVRTPEHRGGGDRRPIEMFEDRSLDPIGTHFRLRVRDDRDELDRHRMELETREALIAETTVDLREVRRSVVDVAVVVVEDDPLGLDDRADLGLVVGAHPREEERVRRQVAHRVAERSVQARADLPRGSHPRFTVGVDFAVAGRRRIAAEESRVLP